MTKHDQAVVWARKELNRRVQEIPLGSNRGPRVEFYQSFDWIPGGGYAWCVCFFLAAWADGAKSPLPIPTAGAYDFHRRYTKLGWTTPSPVPGDAVIFNIGTGHLAMFLRFEGNMVVTIDGNVSNVVQEVKRPRSLVRGYIRIKLAPAPKPKPPLFQVVGSADGKSQIVYVGGAKGVNSKLGRMLKKYNKLVITRKPRRKKK